MHPKYTSTQARYGAAATLNPMADNRKQAELTLIRQVQKDCFAVSTPVYS